MKKVCFVFPHLLYAKILHEGYVNEICLAVNLKWSLHKNNWWNRLWQPFRLMDDYLIVDLKVVSEYMYYVWKHLLEESFGSAVLNLALNLGSLLVPVLKLTKSVNTKGLMKGFTFSRFNYFNDDWMHTIYLYIYWYWKKSVVSVYFLNC